MRLRTLALTILSIASMVLFNAPAANTAPGNTVLIGDSIMANPTVTQYLDQRGIPIDNSPRALSGCASDYRFTNTYRAMTGRPVDNYSCSGASYRTGGHHLTGLANMAARDGKLNAATREVVLLGGANDTYPYVRHKLPVPDIQRNLRLAMERTIHQVRRQAPNARIKVVGYTNITNPRGEVCYMNPPGHGLPSLLVRPAPLENAVQRAGFDAAHNAGATFVNLKGMSYGKDTCAPGRWTTGLVDFAPQPRNLAFHLTHQGITEVARFTARA